MNSYEIAVMNRASIEAKAAERPLSVPELKLLRQAERTIRLGWDVAEKVFLLQRAQIKLRFDNPGDPHWLVAGRARLEEREPADAAGLDDSLALAGLRARAMKPIERTID